VGQKAAETKEQLVLRLREQISELVERAEQERRRLERAKVERLNAVAQERVLQAQLRERQQELVGEEQDQQRRLSSIREAQAAVAEMEASAQEQQRADAAGLETAEKDLVTMREKLALQEQELSRKATLVKERAAESARVQAEGAAVQKAIDELQQRVAALEKEEEEAQAEARDLELEKLKPPPPPAPYFSWSQACESAGRRVVGLRATAQEHEMAERRQVAKRQHAVWRAARRYARIVGLFCSLVGLFCFYFRSLLTLDTRAGKGGPASTRCKLWSKSWRRSATDFRFPWTW
jgi:myosin heavy subunit